MTADHSLTFPDDLARIRPQSLPAHRCPCSSARYVNLTSNMICRDLAQGDGTDFDVNKSSIIRKCSSDHRIPEFCPESREYGSLPTNDDDWYDRQRARVRLREI